VGWGVAYDKVYGENGWCVADEPQVGCWVLFWLGWGERGGSRAAQDAHIPAATNGTPHRTDARRTHQIPECRCDLDGSGGPGCNLASEMYCPNQCSGHGSCNLGFCRCAPGWWGIDCAHAATEAAAAEAAAGSRRLAPWLREVTVDAWWCSGAGDGCLEDLVEEVEASTGSSSGGGGGVSGSGSGGEQGGSGGDAAAGQQAMGSAEDDEVFRGDYSGGEASGGSGDDGEPGVSASSPAATRQLPPPPPPPPPPAQLTAPAASGGADDPFAGIADGWASGAQAQRRSSKHRPRQLLLQLFASHHTREQQQPQHARRPAYAAPAADPQAAAGAAAGAAPQPSEAGSNRARPLIYVYNVPSIYLGRMLQYRMYKESCSWRWFDAEYDNATLMSPYPYGGCGVGLRVGCGLGGGWGCSWGWGWGVLRVRVGTQVSQVARALVARAASIIIHST